MCCLTIFSCDVMAELSGFILILAAKNHNLLAKTILLFDHTFPPAEPVDYR